MADSQSTQKWDALLALPGEEKAQGQLHESHRNPDVFGKEAEQMRTQGHHDNMVEECRTKSKSSEELAFYKGLEQIFSGDPTSQANRGATEPKTSSPLSSQSTSTSDFLDSCAELYPSDLEEDLEGEDSFMLSFCPLGQDTQDTDFAFPANVIDTARLGQRNGSSSSQTVAHADKVNAHIEEHCPYKVMLHLLLPQQQISTLANPRATLTPPEQLAMFCGRKERSTAADTVEKLMDQSSRQMSTLLEQLREQARKLKELDERELETDRQIMESLLAIMAEENAKYRRQFDEMDNYLKEHAQFMKDMIALITTQECHLGGVGRVKRRKVSAQHTSNAVPSTSASTAVAGALEQSSTAASTKNKGGVPSSNSKPARKIRKRVPLLP